ncbi:hypothetical protein [Streptosporangium longisporum]|uniref:hypothetical protein n=1 Tax=Streptosporangium longisporum TaxID=46187 RepID=UPI0031E59785
MEYKAASRAASRAPAGESSRSHAASAAPTTSGGTCWPVGSRVCSTVGRSAARWYSSAVIRPSRQASRSTRRSATRCLLTYEGDQPRSVIRARRRTVCS